VLTVLVALVSVAASAYDFEVDGLYYRVTSFTDLTCEVTTGEEKYTGDIVIPATIIYSGKELSVTSIGEYAFNHNDKDYELKPVTIGDSVRFIGERAFEDCCGLTSVIFGNHITTIGEYAFRKCENLTSIIIPNTVTSIGKGAFYGCGLTSVTIPDSIIYLEPYVFCICPLTSIIISNSVKYIGKCAIGSKCLSSIYCLATNPPEFIVSETNFEHDDYMNATLYVPTGSLAAYKAASEWQNFWHMQEFDPSNDPAGIGTIAAGDSKPNEIYNINGIRQNAPKRGLNIINGKKVVIR